MSLRDYFLDMELDEMCDELGINQEDILDRFKDKLNAYYERVDRGYERAIIRGYEEDVYDAEDEAWEELHQEANSILNGEEDENY